MTALGAEGPPRNSWSRWPRVRGCTGAWLVALALVGCSANKPAADGTVAPPSDAGGAGGEAGMDGAKAAETSAPAEDREELEALDARVDEAWRELEALDDEREKAAAGEPGAADRCERIRGLATEICTLRDRVCGLATEHPGQARYANACARSETTCARARTAADRCPAA